MAEVPTNQGPPIPSGPWPPPPKPDMVHVSDGKDWGWCVRCGAARTDPPGSDYTNAPVTWDRPGCYPASRVVG